MTEKKRLLFVNDEMRMGGVARVLNTLMTALPKDKYEIDLLVLHKQGMLLDEIPEGVNVLEGTPFFRTVDESLEQLIKSGDISQLAAKIRLIFYMKTGLVISKIRKERKKIISRPYDVEVAAKEGFCTIFTAAGDSKKKINWVLTDYSVCNYSRNHMVLVQKALQQIDLNVADSTQAMDAYERVFGVTNGIAIHNLMDVEKVHKGMLEKAEIVPSSNVNVICVARFHPQKGIDRLIEASCFSYRLGQKHTLYLIGGGEEEERLRQMASAYDHIRFLGYRKNPYADIRACDLFVLPSRYEGFATIVNESLLAGTPVLMTNVSGAAEQILDDSFGWVIENNQEALNKSFNKVIKNKVLLEKMKADLQNYVYPNDLILKQFEEIL